MNGAEEDIPIAYTVTGFTLMAPGSCTAGSTTCGHIHLLIDNATSCGAPPYNNDGTGSPTNAIMSKCAAGAINGSHTIVMELHHDDHSPVINPATTMVISDSVQITVTGG